MTTPASLRRLRRSTFLVGLVTVLAVALLPAWAQAATATITGNPLTIYVEDVGNLQANRAGTASNLFFDPDSTIGDAGFYLGFPADFGGQTAPFTAGPAIAAGEPSSTTFAPVSQVGPTGSGTSADPFMVVTVYDFDELRVTQTVKYVNGGTRFSVDYSVANSSAGAVRFRASTGADLYLEGSDAGLGFFDAGPPRLVGGVNQETGRAGGIEEVAATPWDHHQSAFYDSIWGIIADAGGSGFDDSTLDTVTDNGVGVQWDDYYTTGLGAGETANFSVVWTFGIAGLTLDPVNARRNVGETHQVAVTAVDPNGAPQASKRVGYQIDGPNARSGEVTTDGAGRATIAWQGGAAGTDALGAYVDLNGNGSRDSTEPFAGAAVEWVAAGQPPPPPPPSNAFTLRRRVVFGNGFTILVVVAPGPGVVSATQAPAASSAQRRRRRPKKLIKSASRRVTKAGAVRLRIKPTKAGKKVLRRRGRFTARVRISFKPTGGTVKRVTRKITIKKKRPKRRR